MSYYINSNFEINNTPTSRDILQIKISTAERFSNYSFRFDFNKGFDYPIKINKRMLLTISIQKNWYLSKVNKILIKRIDGTELDFGQAISHFIANEWSNSYYENYDDLILFLLNKSIEFLKLIPEVIITSDAAILFIELRKVENITKLSKFYKLFASKRKNLPETDFEYIENKFIEKMDIILNL